MTIGGAFTNSIEALEAQSNALGVISQNIANVNTTGYKSTTDNFQTVLSEATAGTNIFGVQPVQAQNITQQGNMQSTGVWDNLAINGNGFFITNSALDGSGSTYFTRAGNFAEKAVSSSGTSASSSGSLTQPASNTVSYLTDNNGDYLMGWKATDGVVDASDSLTGLTAVGYTLGATLPGKPTSTVTLAGSLPAGSTSTVSAGVPIYDNSGNSQTLQIDFTPSGGSATNTWQVSFVMAPNVGTLTEPGTTTTTTTTPATVSFDGAGNYLSTSQPITTTVTWADGTTSSISVDLSKLSQLASGQLELNATTQNGYGTGTLEKTEFDTNGNMFGDFSNGQKVLLYQLPVANFTAPDSLTELSGTVFQQSAGAGTLEVNSVDSLQGGTSLTPGDLETSNVDLSSEFTHLITTQTAYNSATKVFQAADQMTQTVRDLIT